MIKSCCFFANRLEPPTIKSSKIILLLLIKQLKISHVPRFCTTIYFKGLRNHSRTPTVRLHFISMALAKILRFLPLSYIMCWRVWNTSFDSTSSCYNIYGLITTKALKYTIIQTTKTSVSKHYISCYFTIQAEIDH